MNRRMILSVIVAIVLSVVGSIFFDVLSQKPASVFASARIDLDGGCCTKSGAVEIKKKVDALVFKGCSVVRRAFMTEAAIVYQNLTGRKIAVMGGATAGDIKAVAAGDVDITGTCRPPLRDFFDQENDVCVTQIAWDALVFITHPGNRVDGITLDQARDISSGAITNWEKIGGPDRPIIQVFRSRVPENSVSCSGVGYMKRLMLFGDPAINITDKALYCTCCADVEETVEKVKYTFAVTGISSAKKRKVKILTLDGVEPTKSNIVSAKYVFYRPLYLVTKRRPKDKVKEFIDWLLSENGQEVVSSQGSISLAEGGKLGDKFKFWKYSELVEDCK